MLALSGALVTSQTSSIFSGYMLALTACRYGNAVMVPAACDLVVKVPGSQPNQGVCIFDATDETIVQFSVQEAGETMHLAVMRLAKHTQPHGLNIVSQHAWWMCILLTQFL